MIRLTLAIAVVCLVISPAQARKHHPSPRIERQCVENNNGHEICLGSQNRSYASYKAHRGGSGNCPRNLGCGCNLARHFGLPLDFHGLNLKWARDWVHVGTASHKGCTGCVAVLSRGRGGHVGIVRSYDANGNPVIYSYANGRLGWTTAAYPRHRVIAYRSM